MDLKELKQKAALQDLKDRSALQQEEQFTYQNQMVGDPFVEGGKASRVFGTTTEETRQIIEGPGESLEGEEMLTNIAAIAAAPFFGAPVGMGFAAWRTATAVGRLSHGMLDGVAMGVGNYFLVEPAAQYAKEIHPWLEPIVSIAGGVTSAMTFERLMLDTTRKVLTASAPNFWSKQFGAMYERGIIPEQFKSDFEDLARNSDFGNGEAQKEFIKGVQDLAYNNFVSKEQKRLAKVAAKMKAKRTSIEDSEEVVSSLKKKIATGGDLTDTDYERVARVANRDAIHDFTPEFDALKRNIINERAAAEWAEHPNKDFIDILKFDGGIKEEVILNLYKDDPEMGARVLKALKKHKGLITPDGEADVISLAIASGNKDLKKFFTKMANTPSLNKIRRQKEAVVRDEFDRLWRDEISVRTAEKQSEYLGKVFGVTPGKDFEQKVAKMLNLSFKETIDDKNIWKVGKKEYATDALKSSEEQFKNLQKQIAGPYVPHGLSKIGAVKLLKAADNNKAISDVINEILTLKDTVARYGKIVAKDATKAATQKGKVALAASRKKHLDAIKVFRSKVQTVKETTKITGYLRESMKSVDIHPDYRQQLQRFLEPMFGKSTKLQLDEKMYEFLTRKYSERLAFGADLLATKYDKMLKTVGARPRDLKQYTVDQLRDIHDFVKAFRKVAYNEKYITKEANELWANGIAGEIALKAETTIPRWKFLQPKRVGGEVDYVRGTPSVGKASRSSADQAGAALASLKRMEFLLRQLDGFEEFGPAWTHIFLRMKNAEMASHRIGDAVFARYKDIVKSLKTAVKVGFRPGKYWDEALPRIGSEVPTKLKAIAMALNTGAKLNFNALLSHLNHKQTTKLTEADVLKYLDEHLGKAEWDFVENVHNFFDKEIFPILAKTYKEVTGLTLQRRPGKYYPIAAMDFLKDTKRHEKLTDMFVGTTKAARADVEKSMTMTAHGGVTELDLSLDPILRHIKDSIHLATHWKAIQDVQNITKNHVFKNAVTNTMGEHMYKQFDPWIRNIARPSTMDIEHLALERAMRWTRGTVTIAALGAKVITGAKQSLSLITALPEIGATNTIASALKIMRHPIKMLRAINDASPEMAYRIRTWQREMAEMIEAGLGKDAGFKGAVKNAYFVFIHAVDRITASTVWHGAYLKGLEKYGGDARKAVGWADIMVAKTQPKASPKDLPKIMRSGETSRAFSMFYGYFSIWHNQVDEIVRKGLSGNMGKVEMLYTLAFLAAAPVATWQAISYGANKLAGREIDDEQFVKESVKKLAIAPFAGVPIIRDVASSIVLGYDYTLTPITEVVKSVVDVGKVAYDAASTEEYEMTRRDKLALAKLGAYAFRMPTMQMITTLEGAMRLYEDETDDWTELVDRPQKQR